MSNVKNKNPIIIPKLDLKTFTAEKVIEPKYNTSRIPSSNNTGLDYTFKFHKAKIQSRVEKGKMEDYVFDLENTWSLNIDMLSTMLYDFSDFSPEQKKLLYNKLEKIKALFLKKKNLREDKYKLRGKVLMDKQVLEEFKRRNEENNVYYQEQMDEHKENMEKKESFIKQFEKKFNEVEIYVQREAKANPEKWDAFLDFEIINFINYNEFLQKKKIKSQEEIRLIEDDIKEILKENVELKKRDEYIDMSDEYDTKKSKYKSLIKLYKSKIKFQERNAEHLKSVLKKLNCKLDNITSYHNDLNQKLISGNTKETFHKKSNSNFEWEEEKLRNKFREAEKIDESDESKHMDDICISEVEHNKDDVSETSEDSSKDYETKQKEDIERDNKFIQDNFIKRNYSLVEEPSGLRTPEFNIKQENWDISCIEGFTDS